MKHLLVILSIYFLLFITGCEAPSSPEEFKNLGGLKISIHNKEADNMNYENEDQMIVKKTFDIEDINVQDIHKIYHLPISLDTTEYWPLITITYVDSGGAFLLQNDYYWFNDGWYNPLAKKSSDVLKKENENEVIVSHVYFFTTLKGLHPRSSMSFTIWFYPRYSEDYTKTYTIQNPDQYYMSAEDASMVVTLQDINENDISLDNSKSIVVDHYTTSPEIDDEYLIIQLSKKYDDRLFSNLRAFNSAAEITTNGHVVNISHVIGPLRDFSIYTFIFRR